MPGQRLGGQGQQEVDRLVTRFAALTVEQTAAIPALDPARAPVILGGSIVAREAMRRATLSEVVVSEHDLLDGIIASMARTAAMCMAVGKVSLEDCDRFT